MYVNDYAAVMEMNVSKHVNVCICIYVLVRIMYIHVCLESVDFVIYLFPFLSVPPSIWHVVDTLKQVLLLLL